MPPTPQQSAAGYHNMWLRAEVTPARVGAADAIAKRILQAKSAYLAIERDTGVPWPMTAAIHNRESSLNFKTHLHCGDPLSARTKRVPRGRPRKGAPPFTFRESAVDALTMPPHALSDVKTWSIERVLYETEKYNGWGYLGKHNSPYLWSWTNLYSRGKYVADGKYSASAVDSQAGCVAILKRLAALDTDAAEKLKFHEPTPPKDAEDRATKRERGARAGGAGGAVAGGASEGAKTGTEIPKDIPLLPSVLAWTGIGVGIAIVIVASVLIAKKRALIWEKWTGYVGKTA